MTLTFCGIGAMRTATTWTFACLNRHPEVDFPAGKQIHFWDKHRDNGLDWYRDLFDPGSPTIEGEITPAYAILDHEAVGEIAAFAPDLRVWFVLRHPIDRAWSSVRLKLRREEVDPATLDPQWFRDQLTGPGVTKRNRYEQTVNTWRHHFGSDAFLTIPFTDVETDPAGFLARIAQHIGVDPSVYTAPTDKMAARMAEARNVGYELGLSDELRELAAEYYAADIAWFETEFQSQSTQPQSS